MTEIWLKADEGDWENRKEIITAGIESGVDYILVDQDEVDRVKELGDVGVAAFHSDGEVVGDPADTEPDVTVIGKSGEGDGTLDLPGSGEESIDINAIRQAQKKGNGSVSGYVKITTKEYERLAARIGEEADYLVVIGEDWRIIPLENLIADLQSEDVELIAGVDSAEETRTAFETLEVGSDGVLLDTDDPGEVKEAVKVKEEFESEELDLSVAEITRIESSEMADRVCVDTASLMEPGEGMLVGSMSSGLFLVHAETAESPYVASRPFRVNAGAVHAYIRVPGGGTKYLSEIEAGDEVQIVNRDGHARSAVVGRSKIEKRPMFLVEAEVDGRRYRTLLQNAETIKLTTPDGAKAVTELEEGDEVLLYVEGGARHFGRKIEESIVEK